MKNENKIQEVEKLKGRAMLRWDGKKPLERVDYYFAQENRVARNFPDFLIETTKERYLVSELKAGDEQAEYERNRRKYQRDKSLYHTVFAKEIGFEDFRVVFSMSLRKWQKRLMDAMHLIK